MLNVKRSKAWLPCAVFGVLSACEPLSAYKSGRDGNAGPGKIFGGDGNVNQRGGGLPGLGSDSVSAFQRSVHRAVRADASRCMKCHAGTGYAPVSFAHPDAKTAHDELISSGKVNLDSPAKSRLVERLRNENHNCWGNCAQNADDMQKAIEEWASAVKASGAGAVSLSACEQARQTTNNLSALVTVPTNLPLFIIKDNNQNNIYNPATPTQITFDFPQRPGFQIRAQIHRTDDDKSFILHDLIRVGSATQNFRLEGLEVLVNGECSLQRSGYQSLNTVALPNVVFGSYKNPMPWDKGMGQDTLQLAFAKIQETTDGDTGNPGGQTQNPLRASRFQAILTDLKSQTCQRCHANRPVNFADINTEADLKNRIVGNRPLLDSANIANSQIWLRIQAAAGDRRGLGVMPTGSNGNTAFQQALRQKIQEWANTP